MQFTVRTVRPDEVDRAIELARRVFMQYQAPTYDPEGIELVEQSCFCNPAFLQSFRTGENVMLVALDAKDEQTILGMAAAGDSRNITLVFVDGTYHRQGIGKALVSRMLSILKEKGSEQVSLYASTYGVPFYHALGFVAMEQEKKENGMVFTPMTYFFSPQTPFHLSDNQSL